MILGILLLSCKEETPSNWHVCNATDTAIQLQISENTHDPHAISVLSTVPGTIVCQNGEDQLFLETEGNATLRGLLAERDYNCRLIVDDVCSEEVVYHVPPLPFDMPEISLVTGKSDGYYLFNVFFDLDSINTYAIIVDGLGRVRWQYPIEGTSDVDMTFVEGGILIGGERQPPTELDWDGNIRWVASDIRSTPTEKPDSWNHDAGPTDRQSVLTLSRERRPGDVVSDGFLIKELSRTDGTILGYFSSNEHPWTEDLLALRENVEEDDPFHPNALWEVDGHLLVNLRHLDILVALDSQTWEPLWKLGKGLDFQLLEADGRPAAESRWFDGPHDVKQIGNLLYFFDNNTETAGSRILVLELDETARTARIVREWKPERTPPWFAPSWGGVDVLPDGSLSVAYGQVSRVSTQPHSGLYRINADNKLIWKIELPAKWGTYRSEWVASWP